MPKYYLLDENKNLVEGFDREGFLAVLEQAIEDGSLANIDPNSAFATKIKSLFNGTTHNIEFVTQAQYNQIVADGGLVPNAYYFITDDTTAEDLEAHITANDGAVASLNADFDELKQDEEDFKGEIRGIVGDIAFKKVGEGLTTATLDGASRYFVAVNGGGYAYPAFDDTKKYYGDFFISNTSVFYIVKTGTPSIGPFKDGEVYEIATGGNQVRKDATTEIYGKEQTVHDLAITLKCSTTMAVYKIVQN